MPIISVQLTKPLTHEQNQYIAQSVTDIMENTLGKKSQLTAVKIEQIPDQCWFINSQNTESSLQHSAFVTAHISAGTNTEEEKSLAIQQLYQLLEQTINNLSEISYVIINEIPMSDWGYGGKTQLERAFRRTESGAIDTTHYLEKGKKIRSNQLFSLFKRAT